MKRLEGDTNMILQRNNRHFNVRPSNESFELMHNSEC